ncbi:hypothetical protein PAXINDRAFT_73827 [Paxillus involutus ATCC 200175]|nr:hypothetical protein PAXINDRAFT_73827 [Paxillus involutus ATCC 200175]
MTQPALGLALKALYVQQKTGTRFVAYDEFFSIRKHQEESLSAVTARVDPRARELTKHREKHPCFCIYQLRHHPFQEPPRHH